MTPARPNPILTWLPVLFWAGLIYWLSAQSHPPSPGPEFPFKDKVGHFGLYSILAALVLLPLRRVHHLPLPKAALLAIVLASAYGATDEFHQRFVPHRTCDPRDWAADTAGGCVAATIYYAYESRRSPKTSRRPPPTDQPPR